MRARSLLAVLALLLAACDAEVPEVPDVPDLPQVDVPSLESLGVEALEGAGGIAKILEEQYQLTDVGEVDCPPEVDISEGVKFDCTVMVAGEQRTVEVTIINPSGGIEVSEPK